EFGTDGTKMGSVQVNYGQDNFDIRGSVTARHTDGFNAWSGGSELDGATHFDANLKFNADITPKLRIDGSVRYGFFHSEFDNYGDTLDTTRGNEWMGSLGFNWESEDGTLFQSGR